MQSQIDILVNNQIKMNFLDRIRIKKIHLSSLIGLILLKISFDYSYNNIISVIFGYYNFKNDPSSLSFFISWAFLLTLSPLIVKTFHSERISFNIMSILIITSLVPTTTMIAYNSSYSYEYLILMYFYWLILMVLNFHFPAIVLNGKINVKSYLPLSFLIFIFITTIIYISGVYTGFRFHFGLLDVYEIRAEAREYQVSTLLGYIVTAADNILPILFAYFLVKKQRTLAFIIALIVLLNFGISAVKMVPFLLFFAYIGYLFINSNKIYRYAVWGVLILAMLCIFEFLILDSYIITNFSLFRIFFIPAKLHYIYYEFFSINEFDYFRQSALKYFLDSPYKDNIQFLMGYHDISDFTARANNGLFSDAYLNFGTIGVFTFPIIVVLILKLIEGASKNLNPKILFIITTSVCFVLLGVPFTQALLTSGILLLILVLYTLPRNQLT